MEEKYIVDMYNALLLGHEWQGVLDLLHTMPERCKEKPHNASSLVQQDFSSPCWAWPRDLRCQVQTSMLMDD